MTRGIFFLVAGPAGAGKSTLLQRWVAEDAGLVKAVSVTTRPPRTGEVEGGSYYFWDAARFDAAVNRGEFLEHAMVHGLKYGTPADFIRRQLAAGVDVVKDIDVQGVSQVRAYPEFLYPATVGIFIVAPSREEMVRRLRARQSEDEATFARRVQDAETEMARIGEYEYVVINARIEDAVAKLKTIRLAEHERIDAGTRGRGDAEKGK